MHHLLSTRLTMSVEPLRIICGNPQCKAGLLIKNADKLRDAKCPRCGYINPIPQAVATDPPPVQPTPPPPAFAGDATVLFGQQRPVSLPPPPDQMGWLVVKDELTDTQTFTLKQGINTVGRQSEKRPSVHMIVTRDEYMSRPHCTIEVRVGRLGTPDYILRDGAMVDGQWKSSLNGTYLNGKEPRLSQYDQLFLEDGDTIQIGETKLVLKVSTLAASRQQATQAVESMDYERTVVSFKRQSSTT